MITTNTVKISVDTNSVFCLPDTARCYVDYIDLLYESRPYLSDDAFSDGIITVAEAMKEDIIGYKDNIKVTGKTYYISNHGDDGNDGLTPESPWASPKKLAEKYEELRDGDAVLFERGSEWRVTDGPLVNAKNGVSYGAYGSGRKPILNGSIRNYADESYWNETEFPNIYVCSFEFENSGIMVLDFSGKTGNYNELVAHKRLYGLAGFSALSDLTEDCSYYNDVEEKKLYFCSHKGNPGKRFDSIEIGGRGTAIFNHNAKLIENFEIRFFGYGINGGLSMNVKGCIFSYIGGCQLYNDKNDPTVCGNAIEICGPCDGFYVENCWMYQICDTGITHQQWEKQGDLEHKNISFRGNLVEYCYWSIEFNIIESCNGGKRKASNLEHSYNLLNMGGYGFGGTHFYREKYATLYNCFGIPEVENGVCKKNILNKCSGSLYRIGSMGETAIEYSKNINVQKKDDKLGLILYKEEYPYNADGIAKLDNLIAQKNGIYVITDN